MTTEVKPMGTGQGLASSLESQLALVASSPAGMHHAIHCILYFAVFCILQCFFFCVRRNFTVFYYIDTCCIQHAYSMHYLAVMQYSNSIAAAVFWMASAQRWTFGQQ